MTWIHVLPIIARFSFESKKDKSEDLSQGVSFPDEYNSIVQWYHFPHIIALNVGSCYVTKCKLIVTSVSE